MKSKFSKFKKIWFVDCEFQHFNSDKVIPICLVAHELNSNKTIRLWKNEFSDLPPFSIDKDSLFVSYFSSAELSCHLALDWPFPMNILDLYVEFRNRTNGKETGTGNSLLGALSFFGIPAMDTAEKDSMRTLILGQKEWNLKEQEDILKYCEQDVLALRSLFCMMEEGIDLERSLLRGEYMKSVAKIEHHGIPIDAASLEFIRKHSSEIQNALIDKVDPDRMIFEGTVFKESGFRKFLHLLEISWPETPTGKLKLNDETFKSLCETHPRLNPIRQLRQSLSQLRGNNLSFGEDGRSRFMLSPFKSKTSRNQPSNSKFIFGFAKWFRFLITPAKGKALAYIDWSQQEFGIAAALSKDAAMIRAYESGDPYLAFAKQAKAVPESATKETHEQERNLFKSCALAVQYGMGANGLSAKIGKTKSEARALIDLHKKTYPVFWNWSDKCTHYAMQMNTLNTVFGWNLAITGEMSTPSLKNFPMQSNGAEMLRLATIFAHEMGVDICALVHDAILIEAPIEHINEHISVAQEAMARASELVLDGFRLQSDVKIVRFPDRFHEKSGEAFWHTVQECLKYFTHPESNQHPT